MKGVKNYLKNMTKSFTYAAADTAVGLMPNVKEFTEANKEAFNVTYETLRNPKSAAKKVMESVKSSKVYDAAQYGVKNALEDLRTGNWYNKEREEQNAEEMVTSFFGNWNDLSEFGIGENWETELNDDSSSDVTAGDLKIADSIEKSNRAVANTTANAVIVAADYQTKTSKINTSVLFNQNERLFGGLHKDINLLNTTTANLYGLHESTFKNIDKNMSDFFTRSLKMDTERNAMLKEMLEMQRETYKSAKEHEDKIKNRGDKDTKRWSDVNISGMPQLDNYLKSITNNINKMVKSNMGMLDMFGDESNMLKMFAASPLKGVIEMVTKQLVPATVKAATKELDKSLAGVFGNFVARMSNNKDKSGILGILGKVFGVNTSTSKDIKTDQYYKGSIPFDGITKKAIIDVIPTYLRRIESAISGREEMIFDYQTGKWKTAGRIKNDFNDIRKNAVRRATSDIRSDMHDQIKLTSAGIVDKKKFEDALDEFWEYLYLSNGDFNPTKTFEQNHINDYGSFQNLKTHYKKIQTMFKTFDYDTKAGKNRKLSSRYLGAQVLEAKDYEAQMYKQINADPSSVYQILKNGLKINESGRMSKPDKYNKYTYTAKNDRLLIVKDSYGNNIYDYLQKISSELQWQRDTGFEYLANSSGMPVMVNPTKGKGSKSANIAKPSTPLDKNLGTFKTQSKQKEDYLATYNKRKKVAEKVIKDIEEGKAVYLSDYDDETLEELENLAILLSSKATNEYEEELKSSINRGSISRFINKKFYGATGRLKTIQEAVEDDEIEEKEEKEDESTSKRKKLLEKFGVFKKAGDKFSSIASAPAEIFTDLLESADRAIYEMMFKYEIENDDDSDKDQPKKYEGFMDMIAGKVSGIVEKTGDKISGILDPIKESFGIKDDFKEKTTDALKDLGKNAFKLVIDANKEVYQQPLNWVREKVGLDPIYTAKEKSAMATQARKDARAQKAAKGNDISKVLVSYRDRNRKMAAAATDKESKEKFQEVLKGQKVDKEYEDLEAKIAALGYDTEEKKRDALIHEFGIKASEIDAIKSYNDNDPKNKNKTRDALNKKIARAMRRDGARHNAFGTVNKPPFTGRTMLSKGELLFNADGVSVVNKTDAYDVTKPTHILSSYSSHPFLKKMGLASGPRRTPGEDLKEENRIKNRIYNHAESSLSSSQEKKLKMQIGNISKESIMSNLKGYIPEGIAGGVVGGITSTLLGLVGGPLLGITVGAAGNIIANNESLKDSLFGIKNADGNRTGGIVSEKIVTAAQKYVPNMTKFGLAGIIPGLITPLGPIGGLLAGGAIGFLKSNEEFKEKYFGPEGKLSIDDTTKNKVKKMLPNAGIGAGAGAAISVLFGGPFGLMGNAALGAGIGLMTASDDFKNGILGEKINGIRQGGVLGNLKKAFAPFDGLGTEIKDHITRFMDAKIFDPIQRFIKPFLKDLPHMAGALPRLINRLFENSIVKPFGDLFTDHITKPLADKIRGALNSKIVKGLGKLVAAPVTWPLAGLGKIGDKIQSNRITQGRETQMTASERIKWLNENKRAKKVTAFDTALSNIGEAGSESYNKYSELRDTMNSVLDSTSALDKERKKMSKVLLKRIRSYSTSDGASFTSGSMTEMIKRIKANDIEGLHQIMQKTLLTNGRRLTEQEFHDLTEGLDENNMSFNSLFKNYQDLADRKTRAGNMSKKEKDAEFKKAKKKLAKYGIKVKNIGDFNKYKELIDTELTNRDANKLGSAMTEEMKNREAAQATARNTSNIYNLLFEFLTGRKAASSENNSAHKSAMDDNDAAMGASKQRTDEYYNDRKDDIADDLDDETISDLDDDVLDSFTSKRKIKYFKGIKIPFVNRHKTRPVQDPKLLQLLKSGAITAQQANLLKDGKNAGAIVTLNKAKYQIEDAAVTYINESSNLRAGEISKLLTQTYVKAVYKGNPITVEDLKFIEKNLLTKPKNFYKLCKALYRRGNTPKDFDSIESIWNMTSENLNEPIGNNALGTILATAGTIGKGILSVGKGVVKGAAKVGKGIARVGSKAANGFGRFLEGGVNGAMGRPYIPQMDPQQQMMMGGGGNTSDLDVPGDGKAVQYVPATNSYMIVKRTTDGDIRPDESESTTKDTLNKLREKENKESLFHKIQSKAMDTINNAFDVSKEPESKGGKFSWWKLLIAGIFAAPLLKSVFKTVIQPLWTDHIKPGLTTLWDEYVHPAITAIWGGVKKWAGDTALPWLTGTGQFKGEGLPSVLAGAFKIALSVLPSMLIDFGKSFLKDTKDNVGELGMADSSTNYQDKAVIEQGKYADDDETTLTIKDKYGKTVTKNASGADVNAAMLAGDTIYNEQGIEGTYDADGNLVFEDEGGRGSRNINEHVGRSMLNAAVAGDPGKGIKALDKVGDVLLKPQSQSKFIQYGKRLIPKPIRGAYQFVKKGTGAAIKSATVPIKAAADIGDVVEGFNSVDGNIFQKVKGGLENGKYTSQVLNKVTGSKLVKGAKDFAETAYLKALDAGDAIKGSKAGQKISELVSNGKTKASDLVSKGKNKVDDIVKAGKNTADDVVDATKDGKLFDNIKDKAGKFFNSSKDKLDDLVISDELKQKAVETATDKIDDVTNAATKNKDGVLKDLIAKIKNLITKILNNETVQKFIKKVADFLGTKGDGEAIVKKIQKGLNETMEEGIEKAGDKVAKEATKGSFKAVASVAIGAAQIVADFTYGFDNAEGILGIEEVDLLQEVVCGIINALANHGIVAPILTIFITVEKIAQKIIGMFPQYKDLKEKQKKADAAAKKYSDEVGTTYSTQEFLQKDNWTYKVKKWGDNTIKWVGDKLFPKNNRADAFTVDPSMYGTTTLGKGSNYGKAKQIDPSIAGIRFNAPGDTTYQTIGDSGCGPAAAVTAIQSVYGRGNEVVDAANYAISSGNKERDGGTKPGFFKGYFDKNGLASTTSYNRSEIENNLRSGRTTVLMGKDSNGVSQYTPYGQNPHYVTATGVRGDKVIIQDPESRYSNQVYNIKDVISKTSIGISAYGKSRKNYTRFGRSKYGTGLRGSSTNEQIYNFFIDNGFSPQASAAILGNFAQEAGLDSNGQIKLHAVQKSNSEGIGIVQWSEGRKAAFQQYCNSIGEPWPTVSLISQLGYALQELNSGSQWIWPNYKGAKAYDTKYKISFEQFKTSSDIAIATGAFCANYERCHMNDSHMNDVRIPKAKQFYEQFSGNAADTSNSMTDGTTSSDGSNTNSGGLLSKFTTALNNVVESSAVNTALTKIGGITSSIYDAIFSSADSSSSSDSTSTTTSSGSAGSEYPKYSDMDDALKKKIAGVITGETGGSDLVAAKQEASQMANLNEVHYKRSPNAASINKTLTGGWYSSKSFGKTPTENALQAVEDVLVNGKRTLPRYVTEHDMFPLDAAMSGTWSDKKQDRTAYIKDQTVIKQNPSRFSSPASYKFYDFFGQNKDGDVAGYYDKDYETYKNDYAWGTGNRQPKMISKYGNAKDLFSHTNTRYDYGRGSGHKTFKEHVELTNNPNYGKGANTSIDYTALIKVIIEILITIADNSDKLNAITALLNERLGVDIQSNTAPQTKAAQTSLKNRLNNALNNSMRDTTEAQDNSILTIINAMNAIAAE